MDANTRRNMCVVTVLDTSVATRNSGDEIIMKAVRREVAELLPDALIRTVPTHEGLGARTRGILRTSSLNLAGGSNLVGPPMLYSRLWKVGVRDALERWRITLMGCGWRSYSRRTSPYTSGLLSRLLDRQVPHAVRDDYTAQRLQQIGFNNVLVTGCPTTWGLVPAHVASIPRTPGSAVVVVLNGRKDPEGFGRRVLDSAAAAYGDVYFWPQMLTDLRYLDGLPAKVRVIGPSLSSYERVLQDGNLSLDYVGTRLHAGIRALQAGRRTLIFEVDNRAAEMGATLRLPTAPADPSALPGLLESGVSTSIEVPVKAIESWRSAVRSHLDRMIDNSGGVAHG